MVKEIVLFLLLSLTVRTSTSTPPAAQGNVGDILEVFQGIKEECSSVREEAAVMRQEAYSVLDKATQAREDTFDLREEAFDLREKAGDMRDSVFEARIALERTIVEALAELKSQATVTNIYVQEMRSSINTFSTRIGKVEERIGIVEGAVKNLGTNIADMADSTDLISEKVEQSVGLASVVKSRQQTLISEIRLISHFKLTGSNDVRTDGHESDLAVDGLLIYSDRTAHTRTYTHSVTTIANNKLWVDLGGLFKISKIKIWNTRHCCQAQFVGTHVYADDFLIGTAIQAQNTYTFEAPDSVYANRVTIHQPLAKNLHILELQVWGCGPFPPEDLFA